MRVIVGLAFASLLSGCGLVGLDGYSLADGYKALCEDVFIDDNGKDGVWTNSPASCTGGPIQTVFVPLTGPF